MAVHRSLGWATTKKSPDMTGKLKLLRITFTEIIFIYSLSIDERFRLLSSVPAGLFLIGSFGMLVLARQFHNNTL